jgi:hypothetical protein
VIIFDALVADIFSPEFHDASDLPQHMERCSALRLLPFPERDIFIDHAIDAAVGERQARLLSKFDRMKQLSGCGNGLGLIAGLQRSPEIVVSFSSDASLVDAVALKHADAVIF